MTGARSAAAVVVAGALLAAACMDDEAQPDGAARQLPYPALEQYDAEIFMELDATAVEIGNVRTRIRRSDRVDVFSFLSKEDAYEEFKRLFEDMPGLIAATSPEDLPVSFRVVLAPHPEPGPFASRFEAMPGVESVVLALAPTRDNKELPYHALRQADTDVFMDVDASQAEIEGLRSLLRASDDVYAFSLLSKEEVAAEFRRVIGEQRPDLVEGLDPSVLGVLFRVAFMPGSDSATLNATFEQLPGVDEVQSRQS